MEGSVNTLAHSACASLGTTPGSACKLSWTHQRPSKASCQVHIRHALRAQEGTERGFLNTHLAFCVYTGLLLSDTSACTRSWKRPVAKCQKICKSCFRLFLLKLYSYLWHTWCHVIPAGNKSQLLISPLCSIFKQSALPWIKRMLPICHYQIRAPDWPKFYLV